MLTATRQGLTLLMQGNIGELTERILYRWGRGTLFSFFYYDHFYLFEYDLRQPAKRSQLSGITIRQAGPADIPAMNAIYGKRDDFEKRFRDGCLCFLAEYGREPAGMSWIEIGDVHTEENNEFRLSLLPGTIWAFDSFVAPRYRGKGIWQSIVAEIARHMTLRGMERMYCLTDRFNTRSIIAHLRIGYTMKKEVLFLRAFFLRAHRQRHIVSTGNGPWETSVRFSRHALIPRLASWTITQ